MRSRKIYKVVEAMAAAERERLRLFLQSPLHNPSPLLLALYEELVKDISRPELTPRGPEALHASLPSDSRFSANYFDKLCAMLLGHVHRFLVWSEFNREQAQEAWLLLRAYNRLNLGEAVPALYKSLGTELEALVGTDEGALDAGYKMDREFGMYLFRQPRTPAGEQLSRISQSLQVSYIDRALEIAMAIHNYNQVFHLHIQTPDLAWAMAEMDNHPEGWPVALRVKLLGYRVLAEHSVAAFEGLLEMLGKEADALDEGLRREMHTVALNFCAFQINKGDSRFLAHADGLYMRLLEAGWLLRDGLLPSELFKNIVSLRLRLGELEWTAKFIEAYGSRLANAHDGLALLYNRAVLKFYEGDQKACMVMFEEVLRDVKSDMYYGVDARVFMLKALYDRNRAEDDVLLESQWNAFRLYIMRNKRLGETDQKQYLNFAKLLRKLLDLRGKGVRKPALEKLRAALESLPLSDRHWFEAKLAEMGKDLA